MIELLGAIFIASLIGSPHCAGMCGGIVVLGAGMDSSRDWQRAWMTPVAYNAGRLITYSSLGACAGMLGSAINLAGATAGVQRLAMIIAGAGMIALSLVSLFRASGVRIGCAHQPRWMQEIMSRAFRAAHQRPPVARAAFLGLLTGFLPCGWLYAFVIVAAGTGSALVGSAAMLSFWAGTLPVMLTLAVGVRALAGPFRKHLPAVTAVVLMVTGVATICGRFNLPTFAQAVSSCDDQTALNPVEHIHSLSQSEPSCCHVESDRSN